MKRIVGFLILALALLLSLPLYAQTQSKTPPSLKSILLEQLRSTHNVKGGWFVPGNTAMEGLTAEQANWKDANGNHSVGQLAYHLVFWNQSELSKFKGETPAKVKSNDETFDNFDGKRWFATVQQFDQVMTEWEKAVEAADDKKLESWASEIAGIGAHNAYHIGQIIYVRKEQGSWNPEKGVK